MANLAQTSLKSAFGNIGVQVCIRMFSFLMNSIVLHHISKYVLGIINVRLYLLYSTLLFLSREAFRRACLRIKEFSPSIINVLWLCLPISIINSVILGYIWLHLDLPEKPWDAQYTVAVFIVCVSCIFEILSEPLFVLSLILCKVKLKIIADALTSFIKIVLLTIVVVFYPNYSIHGFCIAQLTSSIIYSSTYYYYYLNRMLSIDSKYFQVKTIFPSKNTKSLFDNSALLLVWSFLKQGITKHVLTEGEYLVMTILPVMNFEDQGIYDVISNLGGLTARLVFAPIEEASYFYFSQSSKNIKLTKEVTLFLTTILKSLIYIGLCAFTFSLAYSHCFLNLYGGRELSSGEVPLLLQLQCVYIVFLAVNGISEAYTFARMTSEQINQYNYKMALFSITFLLNSWLLSQLFGCKGLIFSNCFNMLLRIICSFQFIKKSTDEKEKFIWLIIPNWRFICFLSLVAACSLYSELVSDFSLGKRADIIFFDHNAFILHRTSDVN